MDTGDHKHVFRLPVVPVSGREESVHVERDMSWETKRNRV